MPIQTNIPTHSSRHQIESSADTSSEPVPQSTGPVQTELPTHSSRHKLQPAKDGSPRLMLADPLRLPDYNSTLQRFDPKFWTIDYNALMMATIIPLDDHSFVVPSQFRTNVDFMGIRWFSEDFYGHGYFKYKTEKDYTGIRLCFRHNTTMPEKMTVTMTRGDGSGFTVRLAPYGLNAESGMYECLDDREPNRYVYPPSMVGEIGYPIPQEEMTPYKGRTDYVFFLDFEKLYTYFDFTGNRISPTNISVISFDCTHSTHGYGEDVESPLMTRNPDGSATIQLINVNPSVRLSPGDTLQVSFGDIENGKFVPKSSTFTVESWSGFGTGSLTITGQCEFYGAEYVPGTVIGTYFALPSPAPTASVNKYFTDMKVTGGMQTIQRRFYPQPAVAMGMTSGFDDGYNLTPERCVEMTYQLGYRGWWTCYIGMSHYFSAHTCYQDITTGEYIAGGELLPKSLEQYYFLGQLENQGITNQPVNAPTVKFFERFFQLLKQYDYKYVNSVAYEILDYFCPFAWKQLNWKNEPGLSGWFPPSAFIQPTNIDALNYLSNVHKQILTLAVAAGLEPHFQIGEPWWWDGSYSVGDAKNAPCIYDYATKLMYFNETGQYAHTPLIKNIFEEIDPAHWPYVDWLRTKLGDSTNYIRDTVKAAFPTAKATLLFFTPQIMSPASDLTYRLNFPIDEWKYPNYDFIQIEDYDWIINTHMELVPLTFQAAVEILEYPLEVVHYFMGFILVPGDRGMWKYVDQAWTLAKEANIEQVYLWAYTQVMRDNVLLRPQEFLPLWPEYVPMVDRPVTSPALPNAT